MNIIANAYLGSRKQIVEWIKSSTTAPSSACGNEDEHAVILQRVDVPLG